MSEGEVQVYIASDETIVTVVRGSKSPNDFRVRYRQPGHRKRQPKHVHLIVDLYLKWSANPTSTDMLVDGFIQFMRTCDPVDSFPPVEAAIFSTNVRAASLSFKALDSYGDYPADLLIALMRLVMLQERTNYPKGTININMLEAFRRHDDIFTVIGTATFGGR